MGRPAPRHLSEDERDHVQRKIIWNSKTMRYTNQTPRRRIADFFSALASSRAITILFFLFLFIILPVAVFLATGRYAERPQPTSSSGNWHMIFDDEFNAASLNTSIWTPGWFGTGVTGPVNSLETACYNSAQVTQPGDGSLHLLLIAKQESCKGNTRPYTGSLISSNPNDGVAGHTGFQYTYGYVEFRVSLPAASRGVIANWPGAWSGGQNWPAMGENDTAEGLNGQVCYHFHSLSAGPGDCASGDYTGWHTFGSDWEPGGVVYYYDGVQVGKITTGITSAPQFLVLDNTQGSNGGPTLVPSDVLIDYVRVWQHCTTSCSSSQPSLNVGEG